MSTTQTLKINIKSSIFDRDRELTIAPNFIEFDQHDLVSKSPIKFNKDDIQAFRYGVKWIYGYQFIIGRIYCIDIRENNNRIIKIRLKSIYGIRRKLLTDKYIQIVQTLYNNYFDDLSRSYLDLFEINADFELGGLLFNRSGITIIDKARLIPWSDMSTASYKTYFTIYPNSDPNLYIAFEYLNDWNAGVIYSVSRQILKNKKLLQD